MVGINYQLSGDKIIVDFESAKRVKCVYQDFDDGEAAGNSVAQIAAEQFIASIASIASNTADKYSDLEKELDRLREFKAAEEKKARNKAEQEVFEKFSDLAGNESFETLKQNCSEFDIDTI